MATQTSSIKPGTVPAGRTPAQPTPRTEIKQEGAPQVKQGTTDRGPTPAGASERPTHAQIERRAYEIWLRRGGGDGNAAVDWLQAERELTGEMKSHRVA